MSKKFLAILLALVFVLLTVTAQGCSEADTASANLSTAADKFEVYRRVTFYNGITDSQPLVVEGLCSLGNYDVSGELSVTCKVGDGTYVKHYLGLSDNMTYICEQLVAVPVDPYHYRFIVRPDTLLPDLDLDLKLLNGGE